MAGRDTIAESVESTIGATTGMSEQALLVGQMSELAGRRLAAYIMSYVLAPLSLQARARHGLTSCPAGRHND